MAFESFKRKKTTAELEEERERVTIEKEILTEKAESAEREAVISELKSKYGHGWAKILGINKFASLTTLRSFLVSAKQGMQKMGSRSNETPLGRMFTFKGVKKA